MEILRLLFVQGKAGITNRPLDTDFRKFDHGVHEFGHALMDLAGWIPIIDANNMCDAERGRSSECFCYDLQSWFNSRFGAYTYPGPRAVEWFQSPGITSTQRANFMKKIFNGDNTWMPPVDLRLNGYNPSGSPSATTPTHDILPAYSISAYPNPFNEVLNIEVRLEKPNSLEVEIIDALGRVLKVVKSSNVTDKHSFQVQNLDYKGVLLVKVKSDGKYGLVKVVKNN